MGGRTRGGSGWTWLLLFGGVFCLLFLAMALTVGFGSPRVPPSAVAVIEAAPPGTGTITRAELREKIEHQADLIGSEVPQPGGPDYEILQEQALSELITVTWLAGQAMELGFRVSRSQEQLNLQALQDKVMTALTKQAPEPSNRQPYFTAIDYEFPRLWLPRTHCRDGFVVEQCGNFVAGHLDAPCFEAEPIEPVEGCPAPVAQRLPSEPGTFTEQEPWGEGLPQGPNPG